MNDVKHKVLTKIKCGEVTMRPRWHFVLKSTLAILGLLIVALWLVYLESFILFLLIGTGVVFVPAFGVHGLVTFLLSAPWLLIVVAVLFVLVLEYLVCCHSFGYRRPLLYSVFGIVGVTVVGAVLVAQTDIHYLAMEKAKDSKLPFMGMMYREYGLRPHKDVHVGVVSSTTPTGFILRSRMGSEYRVVVGTTTSHKSITPKHGQRILILGTDKGGTIEAVGIRSYDSKDIRSNQFVPIQVAPVP